VRVELGTEMGGARWEEQDGRREASDKGWFL
jgi:hypothetical protein